LIAQTSGAIMMIDDSCYRVRSTSGNNTYAVTATHQGGFVHVQIMLATMLSANMCMFVELTELQNLFEPLKSMTLT
jgi:hypothetical protein